MEIRRVWTCGECLGEVVGVWVCGREKGVWEGWKYRWVGSVWEGWECGCAGGRRVFGRGGSVRERECLGECELGYGEGSERRSLSVQLQLTM